MDQFAIDSHKLIFHPKQVCRWLEGKEIFPIYIEISPYGSCNHRCIFCALDYLGYKAIKPEISVLKKFIRQIAASGVKSIMFAGEGEPLLNKDVPDLVKYAKDQGLDVAMTTNAVFLSMQISAKILPYLSWLRVSINAGTAGTYALIHRAGPQDFDRVIDNIKYAVSLKKTKKYTCTIGAQFLLLSENHKEIFKLTGILKNAGLDYLIFKPYSQHPSSLNRIHPGFSYAKLLEYEKSLKKYSDADFNIIFRKNAMLKMSNRKPYRQCLGMPFWAYLDSRGNLYACSAFLGDKRFSYGNINQFSFKELLRSAKKRKIVRLLQDSRRISCCRKACRMDEINNYLWKIKNPPAHVNFI